MLSKALGTGILLTAFKRDALADEHYRAAVRSMTQLNAAAASAMLKDDVHAATDITGFGLVGQTTSCLISDVQMPGVSGTELHEILRRRGYSYPIILITAYPNSSELLRATEAGQTFILQKPLDNRALIGNLKDALRRHFG